LTLTFKIRRGLRYPQFDVLPEDSSVPIVIQFYPSFNKDADYPISPNGSHSTKSKTR